MTSPEVGYLFCVVSVLGFGSNYIPVKKIDVKDGVFFTLCLSCGIMLVGLVQWAICGFYKFEPFAMLGGVIWAIANACVPFIIQSLGLGTGQLVWSVTNMLTGWACGTFGILGKTKDDVSDLALNIGGVCLVIVSLIPFMFMRNSPPAETSRNLINGGSEDAEAGVRSLEVEGSSGTCLQGSSSSMRFLIGFIVALIAGAFMGSSFNAAAWLKEHHEEGHSQQDGHYVLSHFVGILLASTLYFIVYAVVNGVRGKESFYSKDMVLPGLASGILWAIAQVGWFEANGALSFVVSFPIIVSVPGVMAAIWGVVLFGENTGRRNLSLLMLIIGLQIFGVILVAVSK